MGNRNTNEAQEKIFGITKKVAKILAIIITTMYIVFAIKEGEINIENWEVKTQALFVIISYSLLLIFLFPLLAMYFLFSKK